ncbi:heavy metal-associated domain-containing protein [Spirochaetia bacterium]|nr:heavy metal-associated domain-containing protein [Spirochaetia bacterium]
MLMETTKNENRTTISLRIGGMTCVNCQNRIEKRLKSMVGVEEASVSYVDGTASVSFDPSVLTPGEIIAAVEELDYKVLKNAGAVPATKIAATALIIFALFFILSQFGILTLGSAFPLAEAGMGYGILFVIGLITSLHCVAMCGGINLSQTLKRDSIEPQPLPPRQPAAVLLPSVLYNGGRIISYTVVGVIVGALGGVLTVSGRFQGAVQLIAGIFMVIMGINMLGFFQGTAGSILRRLNLHLPKIFAKKIDEQKTANKGPFVIGLLNGLMPCGPLQAMQLYALSTGSPIAGGISMFLFSLGTVPLMFGLGALGSFLSGSSRGRSFSAKITYAGAILVTVLGLTMFSNGWSLSGLNIPVPSMVQAAQITDTFKPLVENGVQIINSTLSGGRYPAITVQQGIPVRWNINAPQGSINGCNNSMIIREYGIEHRFTTGDNIVEFTPAKTGTFTYSCWMGMIRSSITVVAEGSTVDAASNIAPGIADITPAGVVIPTDNVLLAEIQGPETYGFPYQTVTVNLRDDGIDPGIVVFQRNMPALLVINNDSLDPGNSRLIFPAFYAQLDMDQGDNVIQLVPSGDFDFSTADNIFYGYVKVVDDINKVNIEKIKAEVSDFEPLIYPESYFEPAAQSGGMSCCN